MQFGGSRDQALGDADLATRFRRHADAIERADRSPLSVALMRGAADSLESDGVVAELLSDVELAPGQAPALRVLAAVHRLVLSGRARSLDRYYPSVGGGASLDDDLWGTAEDALRANATCVRSWLTQPVQTNEPGRSAALMGVLLWVVDRYHRPVKLLEIGASAGLNLLATEYAYRVSGQLLGDSSSDLVFDEPWIGTPVPAAALSDAVVVRERRGCDLSPIDSTTEEGRRTLLSYVWPDELDRIHRMRRALSLSARHRPVVDRCGARDWLTQYAEIQRGATVTVIWQSVVAQYLAPADASELSAHIAGIGVHADVSSPLVWATMEPDSDGMIGFQVKVRCWPGGEEIALANCDDHGPPIRWVDHRTVSG